MELLSVLNHHTRELIYFMHRLVINIAVTFSPLPPKEKKNRATQELLVLRILIMFK